MIPAAVKNAISLGWKKLLDGSFLGSVGQTNTVKRVERTVVLHQSMLYKFWIRCGRRISHGIWSRPAGIAQHV